MSCAVGITMPREPFGYGNATLSRHPIVETATFDLSVRGREPRACLRALIADDDAEPLVTLNVHLGLGPSERRHQLGVLLEALLADYAAEQVRRHRRWPWLWRWRKRDVDRLATLAERLVLAGDFNDFPPGPVSRTLRNRLLEAVVGRTFPSRRPLLRLDRLYLSRALRVLTARVERSPAVARASDHLPIVAELERADWAQAPHIPVAAPSVD
jgi:endonuclease/exonuclease/phosphatase family metal-dependent hydrolase